MSDTSSSFVKTQHHLTLAAAEAALSGAVAKAESLSVAAVIVVTDAAGGVTSLARLDGAPPIAIRHALAKANSATGLKRSTDDVLWRAISGRGDAFVVYGGFPLTIDGKVVGAIGVATGAHEHDSEIAQAGVAALDALAGSG